MEKIERVEFGDFCIEAKEADGVMEITITIYSGTNCDDPAVVTVSTFGEVEAIRDLLIRATVE